MNRVRSQVRGYTIIETLVFLAVSGAIAVSAILMVGGQQRRTSFSQSVREMELTIQDIMNDVSTGVFPTPGEVNCVNAGGRPRVNTGSGEQGTNEACILVGRVIHFIPDGEYRVFSVAGLKGDVGNLNPTLAAARPTLIPATMTVARIPFGLTVRSLRVEASVCPGGNLRGIGFFTNFAGYVGAGADRRLETSARNVDTYALCVNETATDNQLQTEIDNAIVNPNRRNPRGIGVRVCLADGGAQEGLIIIGGEGRQFTTSSEIGAGIC